MTEREARTGAPGGVEVRAAADLTSRERELLDLARLSDRAPVEAWRIPGTSRQLATSTHGVFRFFGKFPPPLARHLVASFTQAGDWVLDPMTGSGTTAVEALALHRNVVVRDVSPLSTLLCRVKTRCVPEAVSRAAMERVRARYDSATAAPLPMPVGLLRPEHWFLPETLSSLGRLRAAIESEPDEATRELLLTAFVSTVRRVSRATTQQGRLFLDAAKARADAWPTFAGRAEKYAAAVASLPPRGDVELHIEQRDARTAPDETRPFRLAIVHPPYFNNYKYSSINSLELAWLGVAPKGVRGGEIREAFKVGRPERVAEYVEDLARVVASVAGQLRPGGAMALMMGDTIIRDTYVDVTQQLLRAIAATDAGLTLDRVVLRVPMYTEASWVASQRRSGPKVGVTLHDFVLLFTRGAPGA